MPNIKSASKRMELSRAANTRNRINRSRIKTAIRRVREAETAETAQVHMKEAIIAAGPGRDQAPPSSEPGGPDQEPDRSLRERDVCRFLTP